MNNTVGVERVNNYTSLAADLSAGVRQGERWESFQRHWIGWDIRFTADMAAAENICFVGKVIWLSVHMPDPLRRVAHAIVHLVYHQEGETEDFEAAECAFAEWLVDIWTSWATAGESILEFIDAINVDLGLLN